MGNLRSVDLLPGQTLRGGMALKAYIHSARSMLCKRGPFVVPAEALTSPAPVLGRRANLRGSHSVQLSCFMARVAGACSELEQSIHLPQEEEHQATRSTDDYRSAQSLALVMVLRI